MTAPVHPRARLASVSWFVTSLVVQVALVVLGFLYLVEEDDWVSLALLTFWCLLGTAYLIVIAVVVGRTARRAPLTERPNLPDVAQFPRIVARVATVLTILVGLGATVGHIFFRKDDVAGVAFDSVAVWAMLLSWGLLHWGYAQLYLQEYYRSPEPPMRFPQTPFPGIVEFVYFSFTLGTSFAASDVEIFTPRLRLRTVQQSIISFFFNGLIIVIALGIIAGAGGSR